MRFFGVVFSLFIISMSAYGQVWSDTRVWSPEWEKKYSAWVESQWQVDFFARSYLPNGAANPYYGLRTDCADTVYAMRVIFSYENKLPFVMNDPTGGSKLITNRMTRFNNISDPSKKIRQFLIFLNGTVSTRSLPNETYPVAINRKTVRPGGLVLVTKINHHSWTLKQILPIGVPWMVYNSVAGAGSGSMLKERQSWFNPYWVFEGDQTPAGYAGFRDWKPVELISKPQWQIPGYSEEQYRTPLSGWVKWAQKRLSLIHENNQQRINRLTQTACSGLQMRVEAVNEGITYLRKNPNRCMDYSTYDTYSTPNRDQRLFDDLISLRQAYKDIVSAREEDSLTPQTYRQMSKLFPHILRSLREELSLSSPNFVDEDSLCPIEYALGRQMDLAEAKRRISLALFSHNPHDEVEYRWGDRKGPSSLAKRCQSWDDWTPDLGQH